MNESAEIGNVASVSPPSPSGAAKAAGSSEEGRVQIRRLAQEFEALLMTQMLRDMRRSLASADEATGSGFGSEAFTDTMDVELGRSLSHAGGLGLTNVLLRAFELREGSKPPAAAPLADVPVSLSDPQTPPDEAPRAPISQPVETAPTVTNAPPGPVSSSFGWRQDPITGQPRFHSGVDIAMAYGRDVRVVADGQVVFAGERGGYGNLVVVQHADGSQTSYGHLSGYDVQAGARVAAGQIVGRSGSTGRSTGPHLHFEVRRDGRALDPGRDGRGGRAVSGS